MKEIVFTPLNEEPRVLEDVVNTWTIEQWRRLSKKEHGPVFQAGGFPWYVLSATSGLPFFPLLPVDMLTLGSQAHTFIPVWE